MKADSEFNACLKTSLYIKFRGKDEVKIVLTESWMMIYFSV